MLSFYSGARFYAGGYKTSPNQVISVNHDTGEGRIVLDPTPPGPQTEAATRHLIRWYNQTIRQHAWPLLVATEFVFRFLAIHRFQDGNGRFGRALLLLALMQGDDPDFVRMIRDISIDRRIERHRPIYYSVPHQASGGRFHEDPCKRVGESDRGRSAPASWRGPWDPVPDDLLTRHGTRLRYAFRKFQNKAYPPSTSVTDRRYTRDGSVCPSGT
jgi:hypothetical protein